LDGTKVRASAPKHKAMTDARMGVRREALKAEIARWFEEPERQDAAEDEEHGQDDDGLGLPPELRELAEAAGQDMTHTTVAPKAQTNFTDPESHIMHTPDGFQQCDHAQVAVDAPSQIIVAQEVSHAPWDVQPERAPHAGTTPCGARSGP